jgi:hypothetical protein
MPANRSNPGVHHTARQSRDREGALADSEAGMRSLTFAARIGASRPSTFMSHTQFKLALALHIVEAVTTKRDEIRNFESGVGPDKPDPQVVLTTEPEPT